MGASSYFAQRVAGGEEARDASWQAARNGSAGLALELATEATQLDPLSSRTWSWLGVVQRGNGDSASSEASFERATQLNPQSATPWRSWATNRGDDAASSTRLPTAELWNRTVNNAPRETETRLERARWLLSKDANDATAIADFETIVRERDEPYGRYPALTDLDNLDFARASLPLAQGALLRGDKEKAALLSRRALDDIAKARPKLARQKEMAETSDDTHLRPPTDLDELTAQFRKVQSDINRK
jgi:tetratricopeptide (TPR) repeat protein